MISLVNGVPISYPDIPVLPSEDKYSVDRLHLFTTFNRTTYLEAFKTPAPAYDSRNPIKRWFETLTLEPDALVTYDVYALGPDGFPAMSKIQMTAQSAASINLPGTSNYPKYDPPPTRAVFSDGFAAPTPVDKYMLSTYGEAVSMVVNFFGNITPADINNGDFITELTHRNGSAAVRYPNDEPRRIFEVRYKDGRTPVGYLLKDQYAKGVGAPGRWDISGRSPVWVPEIFPELVTVDIRPEIMVPSRPLLPIEKFTNTNSADRFEITRRDAEMMQSLAKSVELIRSHLGV